EGDAAVHVAAGNADHQAQVGLDQSSSRLAPAPNLLLERIPLRLVRRVALPQALPGLLPGFDSLGQLDLGRGGQQRHPSNLLKVDRQSLARAVRLVGRSLGLDGVLLREQGRHILYSSEPPSAAPPPPAGCSIIL